MCACMIWSVLQSPVLLECVNVVRGELEVGVLFNFLLAVSLVCGWVCRTGSDFPAHASTLTPPSSPASPPSPYRCVSRPPRCQTRCMRSCGYSCSGGGPRVPREVLLRVNPLPLCVYAMRGHGAAGACAVLCLCICLLLNPYHVVQTRDWRCLWVAAVALLRNCAHSPSSTIHFLADGAVPLSLPLSPPSLRPLLLSLPLMYSCREVAGPAVERCVFAHLCVTLPRIF